MSTIDGCEIEDASGPATAVPTHLRALASTNAKGRAHAIDRLWASLCNQGAVFPASLSALPLLLALVAKPRVRDKHEIIALVVGIAVGDHTNFLDGSMSPGRRRPKPKKLKTPKTPKTLEGQCADAVAARLSDLRKLLGDREARTRAAAAFFLAWFPDAGGRSERELVVRSSKERDAAARASMLIALGHLGASGARPLLDAALEGKGAVSATQTAAAIACVYLDRNKASLQARRILELASASRALGETAQPWNGGDLAAHAALVLASLPARKKAARDIDLAVLAKLSAMPYPRAEASALLLFAKAFPGKQSSFDELTETQRAILTSFTKQGIGTARGRLDYALHKHGLPWLDELPKLLGVERGKHPRFRELLL